MTNYNDPRLNQVEKDKSAALTESEQIYGGMINSTDQHYDKLIDESKAWAEEQKKQQQAQTDFAIEKVEQNKAQANKEYIREQSAAFVDWQKQSNEYGVNAEKMAAGGLQRTGYSESSQVSMYTTYQNRVSTARESYNLAILNYDNAIKDAILQNSAALAQIAHDALKAQLELSLEGFQYKNQLIIEQANKKLEIEQMYHEQYQDVLAQINFENEFAEQQRQFNESMAMQQAQLNEEIRQFDEEIKRLKAKDAKEHELEIKKLELEKSKLEEEKRQFNETMAAKKTSSGGSSSKSSGGSSSKSSGGSSSGSKQITQSGKSSNSGSSSVRSKTLGSSKSNIKLDAKSRARVEEYFGRPLTDSELARYAASGAVDMRISGDTAYFSVPVHYTKQKDLTR